MSAGSAPEPAHDPIAIASLIAELPDLQAELALAREAEEQATALTKAVMQKIDAMQNRIDIAIAVLRKKSPKGSRWNGGVASRVAGQGEITSQDMQRLMSHLQQNAAAAHNVASQNAAANGISNYQQSLRDIQKLVAAAPPMISKNIWGE